MSHSDQFDHIRSFNFFLFICGICIVVGCLLKPEVDGTGCVIGLAFVIFAGFVLLYRPSKSTAKKNASAVRRQESPDEYLARIAKVAFAMLLEATYDLGRVPLDRIEIYHTRIGANSVYISCGFKYSFLPIQGFVEIICSDNLVCVCSFPIEEEYKKSFLPKMKNYTLGEVEKFGREITTEDVDIKLAEKG